MKNRHRVYILRGFSGSGKSSLARDLIRHGGTSCSADDFFMKDGEYLFNHDYLPLAHAACFKKFREALSEKEPIVVVDNTNTKKEYYQEYIEEAKKHGYIYSIIEVNIPSSEEEVRALMARGEHKVPEEAYWKWYEEYER